MRPATGSSEEERSAGRPLWASGAQWPLVGRTEELDVLRDLRRARTSAVIGGPPGVGKSRLAGEALAAAAGEGWATLTIRGSSGFAGVPLGSLRTVLGVASSSDLVQLTAAIEHELVAKRAGPGLLVLAEDAQDLDDASAALLHQLVAAQVVVLLATMRSGTRPPQALTDLWKDGLAARIELQHLSRHDTVELLAQLLVTESSAERIWQVTDGNPLYIREVVLASLESGALREVGGERQWRGEWAADARLQEIVTARLGRLDPDELTAMEMLALAGSIPLAFIAGLTSTRSVEALEERGLVSLLRLGRRDEIAIAHQLHAEVIRSGLPLLRQRAIMRNLVAALSRTEYRRAGDHVRLACWSLEAGMDVDPVTLVHGADATLFQIGHAISAKLDEILPDTPVGRRATAAPAVPGDPALAIRLAEAAYDRTGGVPEGTALARALAWTGAIDRSEAILEELANRAAEVDDRLRLSLALAWTRFWGRADIEGATAVLVDAADAAVDDGDRILLADVYQQLAGIELNTAHPSAAFAYAEHAAALCGVEIGDSIAAPPAAESLAYMGRCGEAIALVDRALGAAVERADDGLEVPSLLFARAGALSRMGRLQEAHDLVEACRQVALSNGSLDGSALFGVIAGEVLLRQGRPGSAGRMFRDAAGLFAEHDVLGYRPWALTGLARARAQVGDEPGAQAALAEARQVQSFPRHFEMSRFLAEVALHTLAGRSNAALDAARAGAAWAREAGMRVDEALALNAWVQIESAPAAAARLNELATTCDSDLVVALAHNADALVAENADGLVVAAEEFAALSAWWMAAEAAAAAAQILERRHHERAGAAVARAAREYASHCEGAHSNVVDALATPSRLTSRELEVAQLVARGYSSQDIADRLFVSRRTVESHLYRVYAKLRVSRRTDLAAALGSAAGIADAGDSSSGY